MNVLEIAQRVCLELSLPSPVKVIGATDPLTKQVAALIYRTADELYQASEWTTGQTQYIVNIGEPIVQTGSILAGATTITGLADTSQMEANKFAVSGQGMMNSARVIAILGPTSVQIDEPATEAGSLVDFTFTKDTFALPADFKWFINDTMWDRSNQWQLIGPISPQIDQWERSGVVTTGPRRRWRQVGLPSTCWRIWPPPSTAQDHPASLVFEYNSSYYVLAADGTRKATITSDLDTFSVDPNAIILGVKWRLWQIKGFSYGALQAEYNDYVDRLSARDGGAPVLNMAGRQPGMLITSDSVEDGNWPGPGND